MSDPRWVDVDYSDPSTLPPIGKRVIVTNGKYVDFGGMYGTFADDTLRMRWLCADMGEIIKWMYLPEPR